MTENHAWPHSRSAARTRPVPAPTSPAFSAETVNPTSLPPPLRMRSGLDLATVLGLGGSVALVLVALLLGGGIGAFFNLPSAFIVIGGTVAVTAISFTRTDISIALGQLGRALNKPGRDIHAVASHIVRLADVARQNGPLALQPLLGAPQMEPVLHKALELVVDGLPADDVERILRTEIEAEHARARTGASVLRRSSEVAPAMGLIGTLVGLVQMLTNLQDPATIGPAMAVALLTTFYGAVLGSMVLSPLAGKVERNADAQALINNLYMLGASSMARQENPRRLEMLINTVLPPELRLSTFD